MSINRMEKFKELGIGKGVLQILEELRFVEPTEIQEKSIPLVVKNKDVIGQAATGSGKTLAFGVGIIQKAVRGKGVQALVLTPTRELAEQVSRSLKIFSREYKLSVAEIYGGVAISPQISKLRKAEIVVGTPGRILDHLERGTLNLEKINSFVLDEADRMVDMGFLPDVERILKATPRKKQMLLFSATVSPDVDRLAKKYMDDPTYILVKSYVDSSKLKQIYYDVQPFEKFSLLAHLLKEDEFALTMVFCNTRRNVDNVVANLKRLNLKAMAIHGGLNQSKRTRVLEDFHAQNASILVCTDVAARGLDIKGVLYIYNYDIPANSTEYIHRVGRTARAGKKGKAISLVSNKDYQNFRSVLDDSSLNIELKSLPEFQRIRANFSSDDRHSSGGFGRRSYGRDSGSRGYKPRQGGRGFGRRDSGRSGGIGYGRDSGKGGGRSYGSRDSRGQRGSRSGSYGERDSRRDSGRGGRGRNSGSRDSRRDSRRGNSRGSRRRY